VQDEAQEVVAHRQGRKSTRQEHLQCRSRMGPQRSSRRTQSHSRPLRLSPPGPPPPHAAVLSAWLGRWEKLMPEQLRVQASHTSQYASHCVFPTWQVSAASTSELASFLQASVSFGPTADHCNLNEEKQVLRGDTRTCETSCCWPASTAGTPPALARPGDQ
jgi:hypothetical protein